MELKVVNRAGEPTASVVNLPDTVFGIEPNDHVIYMDVRQFLANQRQGTHKSKERSELSGSTRKLKRQKGTGGARAGDINSPLFRGGARVFGPRPRDYRFKLNKQVKDLARRGALTYKALDNAIVVVEDFQFEKPSTREFVKLCRSLGVDNKKSLFLLPEANSFVSLSSRNLKNVRVLPVDLLNTYRVLESQVLVLTVSALGELSSLFAREESVVGNE
jgi:50S ribosomal protein L4